MGRINSNIASVIAQANLNRSQNELQVRLERLSTGLQINRGKDDPAGLIISERIRSDIQGINQGIKNSDRASSMISTTEASLAEVNDLLNSIRGLIVQSANTGANSQAERDANQLQIDSAIDSITRISNTASFGGLKLLNGSLDYRLSGVRSSAITTVSVKNAQFVNANALQIEVDVISSAQVGALYYNGGTTPPGVTLSAITLEVKGSRGVEVLSLPSGQSLAQVVTAVNKISTLTGVTARLINAADANSGMVFASEGYGSDSMVSVRRQGAPSPDPFTLYKFSEAATVSNPAAFWATVGGQLIAGSDDLGRDVSGLVNGNLATGRGLRLATNSSSLGVDMLLSEDMATRPGAAMTGFNITGGGALFQLGPDVNALQQVNFGIGSVSASNLGGTLRGGVVEYLSSLKSGGDNSIDVSKKRGSDFTAASLILNRAIDEVTIQRGRLGAFERNVLATNSRSLQGQFENLTASESQIRDADFAVETSKLTRAQILASAGTSVLALANQQSQQVLQLLG